MINKIKQKIRQQIDKHTGFKYNTIQELKVFKECREQGILFIKKPYSFALKVLGLGIIGIIVPVLPALILIPAGIYLLIRAYLDERKKKYKGLEK